MLYASMNPMKNYFEQAIEFENLYKALKKSCRNVRWKDSVVGFESNALKNTYNLRRDLLQGKYKISPYQEFTIYEPKKRKVIATRIRDRQFQKALCEGGLYRDLTEHFIHDNGACQIGKGTEFTFNRMVAHLRRYYNENGTNGWVLKCDIKKFFPTTPHKVAIKAVEKRVEDKKALKAVIDVINSFDGDIGIGLGSQISQLVELAVLDEMDHYIKEQLRIKHYVRYMDDFVLVHPDKEHLKKCLQEISRIVESCGMKLNEKTTLYPLRQGVRLMNWRFVITDSGRILRYMDSKKLGKQRRKLRKLLDRESCEKVLPGTAKESLDAWCANAKHGDTFYRRKRMIQHYYQLKGEIGNERFGSRSREACPFGSGLQQAQKRNG